MATNHPEANRRGPSIQENGTLRNRTRQPVLRVSASKALITELSKAGEHYGLLEAFATRVNQKHVIYPWLSELCDCMLHIPQASLEAKAKH